MTRATVKPGDPCPECGGTILHKDGCSLTTRGVHWAADSAMGRAAEWMRSGDHARTPAMPANEPAMTAHVVSETPEGGQHRVITMHPEIVAAGQRACDRASRAAQATERIRVMLMKSSGTFLARREIQVIEAIIGEYVK